MKRKSNQNVIRNILFYIGIGIMVVSFFVGCAAASKVDAYRYHHFSISVLFSVWAKGFVAGMLVIGFSEIIRLLQAIYDKMPAGSNSELESAVSEENEAAAAADGQKETATDDQKLVSESDPELLKVTIQTGDDQMDGFLSLDMEQFTLLSSAQTQVLSMHPRDIRELQYNADHRALFMVYVVTTGVDEIIVKLNEELDKAAFNELVEQIERYRTM